MPLCYAVRFQTLAKGRLLAEFEVRDYGLTHPEVVHNKFNLDSLDIHVCLGLMLYKYEVEDEVIGPLCLKVFQGDTWQRRYCRSVHVLCRLKVPKESNCHKACKLNKVREEDVSVQAYPVHLTSVLLYLRR